jgi:hypothetical protein
VLGLDLGGFDPFTAVVMGAEGRIVILPPMGKKTGGAPASGTAALLSSLFKNFLFAA